MRRTALVPLLAALLLLAGCTTGPTSTSPHVEPTNSTASETPTATPTTTQSRPTSHAHYRSYTVEAHESNIAEIGSEIARSPDELARWDEAEAAVVRRAVDSGSSPVRTGPEVRLDMDGELVVVNGSYYRVNATVTWRETVTAHNVEADGPLGNRYDGEAMRDFRRRAVNHSQLPPADRRAVSETIGIADEPFRDLHGISHWVHFRNGSLPDASTLADGETHVVRYNRTLWKVRLQPGQTSEQVRYRVNYTLEPVAGNASAWQEHVRRNHVRNVSGLLVSGAARDVVRDALQDGTVHWEGTTENEPRKFRELYDLGSPLYVVRNGTLYRVTVQKVME